MRTVRLRIPGETEESVIVCRKNVFSAELAPLCEGLGEGGGLLLTDSNVCALYGRQFEKYLRGVPRFVMAAGEENKNETTLFALLRAMAENGLRRNSTLIAVGGGVVGDLGGLAAGLYMRGIRCVQVPTTLLAQVDSSVGGKTAVDFCGVKNLVGVLKQPARVLADPVFLRTLPVRELRCGLGEIVKHGALFPPLFEVLIQNEARLFDPEFLSGIVPLNIGFKASVVRQDPRETGLRRCLNLGHTTAHAIEAGGYGLSHGECVLLGMMIEEKIAARFQACDPAYLEALGALCRRVLGTVPKIVPDGDAARRVLLDKKNGAPGTVRLTVSRTLGTFDLLELPFEDYVRLWAETAEGSC